MNKKNTLLITWKDSRINPVRDIVTTKKYYDTVENQVALGNIHESSINSYKHKEATRIIVGESKPSVKVTIEVPKRVEAFKNIKSSEAAFALLERRNKENIISASYRGNVIFEAPKELL